jgi:uncharacterized membrane protein
MSSIFIFFLGFFAGGLFEYVLTLVFDFFEKKPLRLSKKYTVGKKISLFSLPIWGLIALIFLKGTGSYVILFMYSAVIGTFLEGLMGLFIHKIFGVRLWTYHYGKIGNFTSIYSLPYWGVAGMMFALVGKIIGI